jgi:DNA-binding CsgD family transcriptional regulator
LQVADLLAEEKSNSEIAERLTLKVKTVGKYIERLLLITDADSRAGVVMALTTTPPEEPILFERRQGPRSARQ